MGWVFVLLPRCFRQKTLPVSRDRNSGRGEAPEVVVICHTKSCPAFFSKLWGLAPSSQTGCYTSLTYAMRPEDHNAEGRDESGNQEARRRNQNSSFLVSWLPNFVRLRSLFYRCDGLDELIHLLVVRLVHLFRRGSDNGEILPGLERENDGIQHHLDALGFALPVQRGQPEIAHLARFHFFRLVVLAFHRVAHPFEHGRQQLLRVVGVREGGRGDNADLESIRCGAVDAAVFPRLGGPVVRHRESEGGVVCREFHLLRLEQRGYEQRQEGGGEEGGEEARFHSVFLRLAGRCVRLKTRNPNFEIRNKFKSSK